MPIVVLTICTYNRVHQARCLLASVRRHLPEARQELLLVDEAKGCTPHLDPEISITKGAELQLERFKVLAFANDAVAFCSLLKPAICLHLLSKYPEGTKLIYCDADTCWHAPPASMLRQVENSDVVLTPHRLTPSTAASIFSDLQIVNFGIINAGVFAVKSSENSRRFLTWWLASMCTQGRLDKNKSGDQIWLTIGLTFFDCIALSRDPGINVALWNLDERPVHKDSGGRYIAGNAPLSIYHYSGFSPLVPGRLLTFRGQTFPPPTPAVAELLLDYAAALETFERTKELSISYGFSHFSDGKPVKEIHRQYFHQRFLQISKPTDDPFDPRYGNEIRSGVRSLYHADHFIKALHRKLSSILPEWGF